MITKRVLVTGASGQLGKSIQELSHNIEDVDFTFMDSKMLDITNKLKIDSLFNSKHFDYCINCAAYTAVDKAEENKERAYEVNVIGARNLAELCEIKNVTLIHISTDFVFDGNGNIPYIEDDITNPISIYGLTKLKGENEIKTTLKKYFIIRTSWLYSEYGGNFVKTMLKLSQERNHLTIIKDQVGAPTYAIDLAKVVIRIIKDQSHNFGLYHYSNDGLGSWFDFAKAIFEYKKIDLDVKGISSSSYKTLAKRPHFSVLDKSKIKRELGITIPYWRDSLKECLNKID
ncbi:dTDP-4-dehydrorhamnose reductase [Pontimicrobium sp. MEBiC06410]